MAFLHFIPETMDNTKNAPERPPSPTRTTIDKTIQYVLKNGISFEEKLKENDTEGKFSFLNDASPYNAYYKAKLNGTEPRDTETTTSPEAGPKIVTKKPDELLFLTKLPPISAYDLDVIKLTASYVACNSERSADALYRYMDRRGKRGQFAFLNRNHSLFPLFQKFTKQYQAIIDTSLGKEKAIVKRVKSMISGNDRDLYQKAYDRAVYQKKHKVEKKTQEAELKRAQVHYASIEWQDFAFVAKMNFDAVDEVAELAVPLLREEVMSRTLQTKSKTIELEVPKENEKNEKKEKTEKPQVSEKSEKSAPVPKGMKIRAAGESRLKRKIASTEPTIQCPITGQPIPELKFDTHLKILLRDPRYKEQQDNFMKKNFTYASNLTTDQVYENIKRLVKKRGLSEEEEAATKRIDIGPQAES